MSRYIYKFISAIVLVLFFSCSPNDDNPPQEQPVTNPVTNNPDNSNDDSDNDNKDWELVWEDEFNGDLSDWNIWEGGAFNNEIQLYQKEQLTTNNGILTISTRKENVSGDTNPFDDTQKDFEYVSGRIETKVQYGPSDTNGEQNYRFMARIKLPKGFGMWPAFWSYADPWPTKGEIDVLEARGNQPNRFQSNIFYGSNAGTATSFANEKTYANLPNLTDDFHIYELIWSKESLRILFDGKQVGIYIPNASNQINSFFGSKQQIVLNNAVGGKFFPGTNSANYTNNAIMQIDWVRVYKK